MNTDEEEEALKTSKWDAQWDILPPHVLKPLETAQITLNFTNIPSGFNYNEHYAIIILGRADEYEVISTRDPEAWQLKYESGLKQQSLPDYFSARNDETSEGAGGTVKRAVLELKLFNHQAYDVEFRVGVYLYHGLFRPYLNNLQN
mmetsp:Transcript_135/g.112  ORF Transcript_135/g.112 Transcript_135/m.112 type:complete len:146 (-) Transcript_135:3638-4075(-)